VLGQGLDPGPLSQAGPASVHQVGRALRSRAAIGPTRRCPARLPQAFSDVASFYATR